MQWADYLLSAVRYDSDRRILEAIQHEDTGESIGEGVLIKRDELASNLKKGLKYRTVFSGNDSWNLGDHVILSKTDEGYCIRTDSNKARYDNLRFLPEI